MFKIITTSLAATSLLALGGTAAAQDNGNVAQQSASDFSVEPQSAGGFGATTLWAYVNADGTHATGSRGGGSGLANSNRLSTGNYEVIFKRGVANNCVFLGFLSAQDFAATHGFIYTVRRSGNTKGVFVHTTDAAGVNADREFAVLLSCAA